MRLFNSSVQEQRPCVELQCGGLTQGHSESAEVAQCILARLTAFKRVETLRELQDVGRTQRYVLPL
jgi:hypothetical protein